MQMWKVSQDGLSFTLSLPRKIINQTKPQLLREILCSEPFRRFQKRKNKNLIFIS